MNPNYNPVSGKILPVFLHYAVPSVIGILAATSAGVIDGIFVGNYVGATALAAINISLPVFALFAGVVFMLAVGGSVMCGKYMGEKNPSAASAIFSKTLYASLAMAVLLSTGCLLFLDQVVLLLGANAELQPLVHIYLMIILFAAPLLILGLTLDYFVRIDGRPLLASFALLAFAVINIGLDWLFIVHWHWGLNGAAWATAIAEGLIFFILLGHFFSDQCSLRLVRVRDGWNDLLKAAWNGFSEFANEMSIGLLTLLFNWVMIKRLGVEGVAAFTIIGYLLFIGLELCYGISESLQPLVSKNLGARQPQRIVAFAVTALVSALFIGLCACVLFVFFPQTLIAMFLREGEDKTVEIALAFISVFWPAFIFNGMNITMASYFTALHKPVQSTVIALSRSLVLPALGLILLPIWFGDMGVYIAIPIAEALTFLFALLLLFIYRPVTIVQQLVEDRTRYT